MKLSSSIALKRGFLLRCPKCGKGKLLQGYLTPVQNCSHCHTLLGDLRADDAPAWLTILIVGHLLAPLMLYCVQHPLIPETLVLPSLLALAIILMGILLPRAKGVFLAGAWLQQRKSNADAVAESASTASDSPPASY